MSSSRHSLGPLAIPKKASYRDLASAPNLPPRAHFDTATMLPQYAHHASDIPDEARLRRDSYEAFVHEIENRTTPQLTMTGSSFATAKTEDGFDPLQLPLPSSSPYQSSPSMPRVKAPLPDIPPSFNRQPGPIFHQNKFAVQPYGNVVRQGGDTWQQRQMYRAPQAAPAVNAESHVAYPNYGVATALPSYQSHAPPAQANRWQQQEFMTADVAAGERTNQLKNLVAAANRLAQITNSDDAPNPPHECSSPPVAQFHYTSVPGRDWQDVDWPTISPAQLEPIASTFRPALAQQAVRSSVFAPEPNLAKQPRKGSRHTKPGKDKKTEIAAAARRTPFVARSNIQHVSMDGSVDAVMADAPTCDSDADAEGSSDDYFEEAAYRAANGIAQKTPRIQQPKIKLKFNVPAARNNTKASSKSARQPPTTVAKPKEVEPKPKRKHGPAPGTVYKKRALAELPIGIRQKVQPDDASDLLALIAFETENYNKHPKRQEDIKEKNEEIKKENDDLEHKIQRELKKQTPIPERNKYDRKAKRKMVDEESGAESIVDARQQRSKSKKTQKLSDEYAKPIEVPDATDALPGVEHTNYATTIADEIEIHGSIDNETGHEISYTELGYATDSDGGVRLPPLRRLEPDPGSFIFDNASNAIPNPAYSRLERTRGCPLEAVRETPEKPKQKDTYLKTLMSTPKKELVSYVSKQMSHLVKRVEGRVGRPSRGGSEATPGVDEDVMMNDADLPSPKLLMDLEEFARNDCAMVAEMMDADVATGLLQSELANGSVDSDADADGETDVEQC